MDTITVFEAIGLIIFGVGIIYFTKKYKVKKEPDIFLTNIRGMLLGILLVGFGIIILLEFFFHFDLNKILFK